MQRKHAQVRRVELLEAAVAEIHGRGMAAVRMSDVAAALDVSPSLVAYHFETKENLLAEALRHAAEIDLYKLRRRVASATTSSGRLLAALQWYAPSGKSRGWLVWIDAWSVAIRTPAIAAVLNDLQSQWTQAITELIEEGVAEGVFTASDAAAVATRITALLDGLAVRTLVHGERLPKGDLQEWIVQQTSTELRIPVAELRAAL